MTKTAEQADVILPSTSWGEHGGIFTCADRGFQRFEKAIEPQGNVKRDWEIISLLATEMGYPMSYTDNKEIWDELRELCPLFYGVTYENWKGWHIFSGRARQKIIRGHHTSIRITSLIPRQAKDCCLPHRGGSRRNCRMMNIR